MKQEQPTIMHTNRAHVPLERVKETEKKNNVFNKLGIMIWYEAFEFIVEFGENRACSNRETWNA